MQKKVFLLLVKLLVSGFALAQLSPEMTFTRDELQSDLKDLRKTILESHPNPFEFCTKKQFEDVFLASQYALDDETTLRDFAFIVANLLNTLRDSHTAIDYNQLQRLQMNDGGHYVPLTLERVEREDSTGGFVMLVRSDWQNNIPKGSQLLSINGQDVNILYKDALGFACVEGDATKAQESVATAILPIITGLSHPYGSTNTLRVVPYGENEPHEYQLKGYTEKQFLRKRAERDTSEENREVSLKLDETHSLAILKVGTFAPSGSRRYRKAIESSMSQIRSEGFENLVLDIRGNGGGSSAWVEYLYSFLDSSGYNTPSNVIGRNSEIAMARSGLFNSAFGRILTSLFYRNNEDVQSFRHFSDLAFGAIDTVFFHKPTRQHHHLVFDGNCFLLINGLTASAGVDFTNAFKTRNRGKVIGEQCLGPQTGTWGNPAWYTLPVSGLNVSIATIRYNYDNTFEYAANGIDPDYVVDCSAADIHLGEDTQVEFVKKLIEGKK